MKPGTLLFCSLLWVLPACAPNMPVIDPTTFEGWYEADQVEKIILIETRKQAEIHRRDSDDTYYLHYDNFGTFVNDYLITLNQQYPERDVVISVR